LKSSHVPDCSNIRSPIVIKNSNGDIKVDLGYDSSTSNVSIHVLYDISCRDVYASSIQGDALTAINNLINQRVNTKETRIDAISPLSKVVNNGVVELKLNANISNTILVNRMLYLMYGLKLLLIQHLQ
jgi:hypothetical protein